MAEKGKSPPSYQMVDMTKRPVPELPPELPPELDVGHPMHMTPFEDRIIRVVSDKLNFYLKFANCCRKREILHFSAGLPKV